jgi:hypothetical protein
MVRSGQPTGVLIPVVYLFGGRSLRLRTRRSHKSTWNTENTASLCWFGPPESNTLCLVVGVDCLGDWSMLYWPADEVGSQTHGPLRPGDLSLRYTSCHIPSICFRRSPPRSSLVLYAKSWGRVGLGRLGESSGRSSGVRVGRQLGRLDPLIGRRVF